MRVYCQTCRFWDKTSETGGLCRIRPPGPGGTWPVTSLVDWCGAGKLSEEEEGKRRQDLDSLAWAE